MQAYKTTAIFLWQRISEVDNSDTELLKEYGAIISTLTPLLDKHLPFGFMRELDLWIGVKLDAPGAFKDYGLGIKKDYPEIFNSNEGKSNN